MANQIQRGGTVPATLRVERLGVDLHRAPFTVTVDGAAVGSLRRDSTFEAAVAPGRHTLQMRAGRYSSQPESFDVADGEAASFRCPAIFWPRYVASIVVPSLGISLKRAA
jgi:hypothetical protein